MRGFEGRRLLRTDWHVRRWDYDQPCSGLETGHGDYELTVYLNKKYLFPSHIIEDVYRIKQSDYDDALEALTKP